MGSHTFNSSTYMADLQEFNTTLVYIASYRMAKDRY